MRNINKPLTERKPDDRVYFDGPDAFADTERAQKELEAELAAMTPEQRDAARIEALVRIEAARKVA